ncbi:protein transport protein SEC31 homolog B-like [Miscanthus floridulus]|uniref:protein transport protein SEC31 homolog B-like n=1 Tax=Miscanthus floridulus TaxID=154761 RepID=UPI00345ACFC6
MMFLEWHPFLPAILASTCDIGDPKIWDLRENSWKMRYQQDDKRKCICSEVHWNPSNPWMLAAASKDSFPMKIWDTRHSQEVLFEFGTGKGVASFSWSPCGQIITTDVDGASDCWKLDKKWVYT